ncbi:MAG: imidazolonepropionase [Chitinophagaceae bacterium]|nr:imidazolonepropionase [Chitinophagaceae bacterium]
MPSTIILNIKELAGISDATSPLRGAELARINSIKNAYLVIEGEDIAGFGRMEDLDKSKIPSGQVNAHGKMVLPAWCDSHTHLVYAGSREGEFVDKIRGLTYAEIAAKGGGILNSASKLNETTEEQLFIETYNRLKDVMRMGTANIEIKSGYGLTLEGELKMLRVIKKLKERTRVTIRSTFLGAHAVPSLYSANREGYISLIIEQMIPAVAKEKLADYIDVFCEKGFFSVDETERICKAGMARGLKAKIHANQLSASGAVQSAVKLNALSVDHLEVMNDDAINALCGSKTIGTLLPTAAMFLRMPYPPARTLIDRGCAVALATDCNPGSSPGYNMNFVVSLACIGMKMLPEEAINAATFNGACALELQNQTGSIARGKKADLIITKNIPSLAYLPYSFSSNHIEQVMIKGELHYV